jgi:hypothetical protein
LLPLDDAKFSVPESLLLRGAANSRSIAARA